MTKRTLVSFILLVAIQTTAGAEMYRCELADGSVIYGDRRVNLSDQCQPVTAGSAEEYLPNRRLSLRRRSRRHLGQREPQHWSKTIMTPGSAAYEKATWSTNEKPCGIWP